MMRGMAGPVVLSFALILMAGGAAVSGHEPTARRPQDVVTLQRTIIFKRGANSAVMRNAVRRGQLHWYKVRVREGQEMSVTLRGRAASFTLYTPDSPVEGADGVERWRGRAEQSGEYLIQIATGERTAPYTLEVAVK